MSKRAERRHHRARVVAKAKKIMRKWCSAYEPDFLGDPGPPKSPDFTRYDGQARKVADNLSRCSLRWCGCRNPRRQRGYNGSVLTRQERLAALHLREEIFQHRLDTPENE
jgi:hypothetical protein